MRRQFETSNQLNVETTSLSQQKDEKSKQCSQQGNEAEEQRLNQSRKLKRQAENLHCQLIRIGQGKKLAVSNDTKYTATPDLKTEIEKMENSVAEENIQQKSRLLLAVVEPNTIIEIVGHLNDIPVSTLRETEEHRLSQLCVFLLKKIIGQDEAVRSIAGIVQKNRTNFPGRNQPIGSFLFLGPTGFGKTKLAKTLALEIFNSTESMIRINMSQYTECHLVDELIGASPNSDSFQRLSQLEEAVLRNPCVVIVFDKSKKHIHEFGMPY